MNDHIKSGERFLLCVAREGERGTVGYYPMAEFFPASGQKRLMPYAAVNSLTTLDNDLSDFDFFFNPPAFAEYGQRDSDFLSLKVTKNRNSQGYPWTESLYNHNAYGHKDENLSLMDDYVREVLMPEQCSSEGDLRRIVEEGIPFNGRTTWVFYIAYEQRNGIIHAIECRRQDYQFDNGLVKLRPALSDVRHSVRPVPRVCFKAGDMIESSSLPGQYRIIYAGLSSPQVDGDVLLRPLSHYASDYVKWFVKDYEENISKADRRRLGRLVENAFSRPDALEKYLKTDLPQSELDSFQKALALSVDDQDDIFRKLLRDAMLEDESFFKRCVEADEVLAKREKVKAALESKIGDLQSQVDSVASDLESLRSKKAELEKAIKTLNDERENIQKAADEALEEIQSNIALRLGLGSVAGVKTGHAPGIATVELPGFECAETDDCLADVLAANMRRLGITSVSGEAESKTSLTAMSMVAGTGVCRTFAVPKSISDALANALSAALCGMPAKKAIIPADCRDVGAVLGELDHAGSVLVLDNVIDPVNEGVLAPLLFRSEGPIVVLPFLSHASAKLLAREAWDGMFLPCVEGLVLRPGLKKTKRLQQTNDVVKPMRIEMEEASGEARDLMSGIAVSDGVALLGSSILEAARELLGDEPPRKLVSQYLSIALADDGSGSDAVARWCEGSDGFDDAAE